MKLDLDKLESKAREDSDHNTMSEIDPDVTLALIARVRELELEIGAQADGAPTRRTPVQLIRLLEKGAVLS